MCIPFKESSCNKYIWTFAESSFMKVFCCHSPFFFKAEVPNPRPADHIQPSNSICAALHPIFEIFYPPFDVDFEEIQLQIDRQCPKDLELKFLACHILDFYKNHMLLSGRFLTLFILARQIMSWIDTTMKHANCMLHLEQSNHHLSDVLLLKTFSSNLDITSFCNCKQHQMSHL